MEVSREKWDPIVTDDVRRRCQNCNSHVTRDFARVFGDNANVVHACPDCTSYSNMRKAGHVSSN